MVIAVVGSGGKTTYIHKEAKRLQASGKKVVITTTTHMYIEENSLVYEENILKTDDPVDTFVRQVQCVLNTSGYAHIGQRVKEEPTKVTALPEQVFRRIVDLKCADVILVEADGAKSKPLKWPRPWEPVIPSACDKIVMIAGLSSIGHPLSEVAHHPEWVASKLQVSTETCVTEEHWQKIIEDGYRRPLQMRYPMVQWQVVKSCQASVSALWKKDDYPFG